MAILWSPEGTGSGLAIQYLLWSANCIARPSPTVSGQYTELKVGMSDQAVRDIEIRRSNSISLTSSMEEGPMSVRTLP